MLIWRDEWRLVLTSGCARRATPCSVTSVRLVRTRAEGLGRPAWGAVGAFGCLLSARRARSARCARRALHGVKKTRGAMAIQGLQSPCQSELMVESYDQIKIQSNRQPCVHTAAGQLACRHAGRGQMNAGPARTTAGQTVCRQAGSGVRCRPGCVGQTALFDDRRDAPVWARHPSAQGGRRATNRGAHHLPKRAGHLDGTH